MRRLTFLLACGLLAACEATPPAVAPMAPPPPREVAPPPAPPPPAPTETPDADFRQKAPEPGPAVTFTAPAVTEEKLSNGIRVLMVERHDMPIVSLQVVSTRGADQARPGVGSFAGAMLLAGTKKHTATELSDLFETLGAEHWSNVDYDSGYIAIKVLSSRLPDALGLVAEAIQSPSFPKDEFALEKSRRQTALSQERDNPSRLLQRSVMAALYPGRHPYGSTLLGDEAALDKITAADLATFHRAQFQPDRLTVAVAGDFSRAALIESLEKTLGKLRGKADKGRDVQAPPAPTRDATRVLIVDRPGATQSSVSVALVGVPRRTPDYEAIMVMNTILGGQFSSRLNLNLREKHGYTYGAGSSFAMRQGAGPFSASGAIVSEHTAAAIKEIFAEVDTIRSKPISEEELTDAKRYLIKQLPALFETTSATVSTLVTMATYGLPLDEYAQRPARLDRVTQDDVKRVAEKLLVSDQMRVVIVGDAEKIRPALEELKLGKIEVQKPPAPKDTTKGAPKGTGKPASKPAPKKK